MSTKLKRIALITDGIYPYVIGGMQKHSFYLAKYLAQKGILVDLYHTNQSKYNIQTLEFFTDDEKKNINSFVVPFPESDGRPGHYIRQSYKYSEKVYEQFSKNPLPDFIYIKGFAGWKLLEQRKNKGITTPTGINFHGYEMFQRSPNFKTWLQNKLLLSAPVLKNLFLADYAFSYGGKITTLIKNLRFKPNDIIELSTGIDENWIVAQPSISTTQKRFVFVGRFERRKGIEELTQVLNELIDDYDLKFTFIGPIPPEKQIKNSKISYTGSITDPTQMQSLLKDADVLVCPSYSEGMPNVIVEAMASGCAIIASNVGAISVMVNEANGTLIEAANKTQLKQAMISLLKIPAEVLNEKRTNSINLVKNELLWNKIIEKTIKKIEERLK